jgi:hypothetical protein
MELPQPITLLEHFPYPGGAIQRLSNLVGDGHWSPFSKVTLSHTAGIPTIDDAGVLMGFPQAAPWH